MEVLFLVVAPILIVECMILEEKKKLVKIAKEEAEKAEKDREKHKKNTECESEIDLVEVGSWDDRQRDLVYMMDRHNHHEESHHIEDNDDDYNSW